MNASSGIFSHQTGKIEYKGGQLCHSHFTDFFQQFITLRVFPNKILAFTGSKDTIGIPE